MASAPTLPLMTAGEYLRSSWRPDKEFVEGVLVDRGMPTIAHALLQVILTAYFRGLEEQYRFKVLTEARTQIVAGARYRVPDVLLCATPLPKSGIVDVPPLAVIEILSPDDRLAETLERFRDYERIGVQTILQLDPVNCAAWRCQSGSLLKTVLKSLHLPRLGAEVPFDSESLFQQLRRELDIA